MFVVNDRIKKYVLLGNPLRRVSDTVKYILFPGQARGFLNVVDSRIIPSLSIPIYDDRRPFLTCREHECQRGEGGEIGALFIILILPRTLFVCLCLSVCLFLCLCVRLLFFLRYYYNI